MKVAVIGAGFTGLAAAWDLAQAGHQVVVYEGADRPGGLAAGFSQPQWQWQLEHHYHHIFSSDKAIINWVTEVGLADLLFFSRVKTSMRYDGQQFQLDSPLSLLRCPVVSSVAKVRTAATLAMFKLLPMWQWLEQWTVAEFLQKSMGEESWRVLWQPLMQDKFGQYAEQVNAAWFWARIQARTPQLGYFTGGFGNLAEQVMEKLRANQVEIHLDAPVERIDRDGQNWRVSASKKRATSEEVTFDTVLFTGSAPLLSKLVTTLPDHFLDDILQLRGLAARTLVLELDKSFFADGTYWLSVNESSWPFLAVLEHTNLVSPKRYGGKHIVYVAKYLETTDPLYACSAIDLLKQYQPSLDQLSPGFQKSVKQLWTYSAPFAQPVPLLRHSRHVPPIKTPLPGLFWASMQHVYPWDRGTNFAVDIGRQAARLINS